MTRGLTSKRRRIRIKATSRFVRRDLVMGKRVPKYKRLWRPDWYELTRQGRANAQRRMGG